MPGFTNTASSLSLVQNDVLSVSAGDRSGVDNVVILMTDGNSNVQPENTSPAAQSLQRTGARVMVVGVGASEDINR